MNLAGLAIGAQGGLAGLVIPAAYAQKVLGKQASKTHYYSD